MLKAKTKIRVGLLLVVLISIFGAIASGALHGVAYFFILTVLLWAIAKTRHWI
jgi:hypothetical protein